MANRPRRPRPEPGAQEPNGVPPETDAPVAISASSDEPASPASPDDPASSSSDVNAPEERAGKPLPPPAEQESAIEASASQQAGGEDSRIQDPVAATDRETSDTFGTFASEEGLSTTQTPARRHLGEFEDDETATEADAAHPLGVTDAYRDHDTRTAQPEPVAASSPSFGALAGAGLAGAILALFGGALLFYAGLLPGTGQNSEAANQFAAAGDLEAVSSELASQREIVEQLQSAQAAGGTGTSYASATDLAALNDRLAAAEQTLQGLDGAADPAQAIEAAETARTTAETAQGTAQAAEAAAGEAASRLDGLEERFTALEQSNRQAGIALSAAGLKAAIDRGGPFMPELETFATASGGGEAVEGLRQFAAEGVPTQAALAAEWPEVEAEIRRSFVQPETGAAVGDQLLAGLSSLVTVRSTGESASEGDERDAVLSRMSAAIQSGDLDAWLTERQTLEPAAQSASQAFADRVQSRNEATSVVDEALAAAAGPQG